ADPERRCVSITCGHVACHECAERTHVICQCCWAKTTGFVSLIEDEQRSRECRRCLTRAPLKRCVFRCGHTLCAACTLSIRKFHPELTICPFCQHGSTPIQMEEPTNISGVAPSCPANR
ncbi:hypothetical protein PENTCL1PPCAC_24783, partial [Pristionchus entomophagus]